MSTQLEALGANVSVGEALLAVESIWRELRGYVEQDMRAPEGAAP